MNLPLEIQSARQQLLRKVEALKLDEAPDASDCMLGLLKKAAEVLNMLDQQRAPEGEPLKLDRPYISVPDGVTVEHFAEVVKEYGLGLVGAPRKDRSVSEHEALGAAAIRYGFSSPADLEAAACKLRPDKMRQRFGHPIDRDRSPAACICENQDRILRGWAAHRKVCPQRSEAHADKVAALWSTRGPAQFQGAGPVASAAKIEAELRPERPNDEKPGDDNTPAPLWLKVDLGGQKIQTEPGDTLADVFQRVREHIAKR